MCAQSHRHCHDMLPDDPGPEPEQCKSCAGTVCGACTTGYLLFRNGTCGTLHPPPLLLFLSTIVQNCVLFVYVAKSHCLCNVSFFAGLAPYSDDDLNGTGSGDTIVPCTIDGPNTCNCGPASTQCASCLGARCASCNVGYNVQPNGACGVRLHPDHVLHVGSTHVFAALPLTVHPCMSVSYRLISWWHNPLHPWPAKPLQLWSRPQPVRLLFGSALRLMQPWPCSPSRRLMWYVYVLLLFVMFMLLLDST